MLEIKSEYTQTDTLFSGIPIYHVVIRINHIKKLISIAKQYNYHKKHTQLPPGITLMHEILYESNPCSQNYRKPKVPLSLCRKILKLAEYMKQTPLPFRYVKQQNLFIDVIFHLVSEEVVVKGKWYCSCFSSFPYILRNKDLLKEILVDMADVVYKIQSKAALVLPEYYYQDNDTEEQNHFHRITEIGLKEHLLG